MRQNKVQDLVEVFAASTLQNAWIPMLQLPQTPEFLNGVSREDAVILQPAPLVIQPMSHKKCTDSRKSPDRVISKAASRAQVEPLYTLDNKGKKLGVS